MKYHFHFTHSLIIILLQKMSLQVKVINAVLTRDTELLSNMDPYCILRLGQQTFRSRTKNQAGKRPVWNQTFTFNALDNILKVTVMDQDTITDDLVGQGTIDISRFRNNQTEQQQLVQLFYQGRSAGKAQLFIRALGSTSPNTYGTQPNIMPNLVPGMQAINSWGQNTGWGCQTPQNQWGNQKITPQINPYGQMNQNFNQMQPMQPTQPQQWGNSNTNNGWGNLNTNNGWGNFQPSANLNQNNTANNLYPSLDNPNTNNNNFNPLNVMGQMLGQQLGNNQPGMTQMPQMNNNQMGQMNNQMGNNVPLQYQMINGMGILNKNSYGNNPYQ